MTHKLKVISGLQKLAKHVRLIDGITATAASVTTKVFGSTAETALISMRYDL